MSLARIELAKPWVWAKYLCLIRLQAHTVHATGFEPAMYLTSRIFVVGRSVALQQATGPT